MKKVIFALVAFSVFTISLFSSCTQEETNGKPTVETNLVSSISEATAVCLGILTSDGGSEVTTRGFCWSTSPIPTIEDDTVVAAVESADFTCTLEGLTPATRYYVRAYAINQGGVSYGVNLVFTTKTFSIVTTPISVLMLTASTAVSGGSILSDGDSSILTVKERGVCWSTMPSPTIENQKTSDGLGGGKFASKMDSLTAFTTYYVRAYATNGNGTIYGDEVLFTTLNGIVGMTTKSISSITAYTAVGGGSISTDGGAPVTEYGLCWSTNQTPTTDHFKAVGAGNSSNFVANLSSLTPHTNYYVRTYAINSVGTSYGNEVMFQTQSGVLGITTKAAASVTIMSIVTGGTITSDGGAPVTERGICWSTSPNPTTADNKKLSGSGLGSFTTSLSGLTPNTTYYLRAYGVNRVDTTYATQTSFTTQSGHMTIVTNAVFSITALTGSCVGTISADGGANVTERGLCWSSSPNPTTSDFKSGYGTGVGSFTVDMSALRPATTYYVRAYGVNSVQTSYGNEVSFTTNSGVIGLTTNAATSISINGAICGGTISSNGGATVTASGICWSTSENPTLADNKLSTATTTGTFSGTISGLMENTSYFVRSWATNAVGTSYGNQIQFTTLATNGTVTDIEGNVYKYITIGTQSWMIENLRTTKYNDGTNIPLVTVDNVWRDLNVPGFCHASNDPSLRIKYGALYNWYSVNTGKLAPAGWHVPTSEEWTKLEKYLIANGYNYDGSTSGNKIAKSLAIKSGWAESSFIGNVGRDQASNNASGFSASPVGYRGVFGELSIGNTRAYWWTSSNYDSEIASMCHFGSEDCALSSSLNKMTEGYSVRCVKNY